MNVDLAFDALGDRTRRQILGRLAHGSLSVGELARALPVGRPAVSMHLRVLREAGLVAANAEGARRLYQIDPGALAAVRDYLDWYWTQALEAFKQYAEVEGEKPMEPELRVTKSIVVDVSLIRAFQLFLDQERWWPAATHHLAEAASESVVLEPFVGGRWYERAPDGRETDWGRVLVFEPPRRILLGWQVSSDWRYEPDPARASEIEVIFVAEGRRRTRIVFEHRHLERYGEQAARMRAILDRPNGAEAVLRAYAAALTTAKVARRRRPEYATTSRTRVPKPVEPHAVPVQRESAEAPGSAKRLGQPRRGSG